MVAVVGLTHMVSVLVNDGVPYIITVFERNEEI